MPAVKQRDYMFDIFRGLLILSIPISHFTKMTGNAFFKEIEGTGFQSDNLFGFMYITINLFVMEAFMFLSGYFSKNGDRAQQTAFKTFMWPYLVFTVIYYFIRMFFFGNSNLNFLAPPFALWFLFVLFFYRFFLKYMMRFRWLLPFSMILFIIAGYIDEWGDYLSLGRMMSYFVFFLLGVYCSKERLAWFRKLRSMPVLLILLGVVLVAISVALCIYRPVPEGWYLLKESYHSFKGMEFWQDTLWRVALFFIAVGWIIFCVNVIPNRKGFLAYVGANTMPVYVFHLTLRYVLQFYGIYYCFFSCLVVAAFGLLGVIFMKAKHWVLKLLYAICIIALICASYWLYTSGILEPYKEVIPESIWINYALCYGGAIICGIAFVSPFWTKLYSLLTDGPKYFSKVTKFLLGPGYEEERQ